MNPSKCEGCGDLAVDGGELFCERYKKPCRRVRSCSVVGRRKFNRPFSRRSAEKARKFYEEQEA